MHLLKRAYIIVQLGELSQSEHTAATSIQITNQALEPPKCPLHSHLVISTALVCANNLPSSL